MHTPVWHLTKRERLLHQRASIERLTVIEAGRTVGFVYHEMTDASECWYAATWRDCRRSPEFGMQAEALTWLARQ